MGAKKRALGLSIIRGLPDNVTQLPGCAALCKLGGVNTLVCYKLVCYKLVVINWFVIIGLNLEQTL